MFAIYCKQIKNTEQITMNLNKLGKLAVLCMCIWIRWVCNFWIRIRNTELELRLRILTIYQRYKKIVEKSSIPYLTFLMIYYLFDNIVFLRGPQKCPGRIRIRIQLDM
jgi:hypothetical protein